MSFKPNSPKPDMTLPVLDLPDGDYLLPPGKIASVVTHLEQREKPPHPPVSAPAGVRLDLWADVTREPYLALFREIGEPWLWFGRLIKTPEALQAIFDNPRHHIYLVLRDGQKIGLLELDHQSDGHVEIAYFGLIPSETGSGLGRWLMIEAQNRAWSAPETRRLWVHTCTADHPAALPFYQRMGFVPFARGLEILDDPRLTGIYANSAGPSALPVIT
jgi:GNAT superfamily N-acetyltransferase